MSMNWKWMIGLSLLCLVWTTAGFSEEYSLRYFLEKNSSKTYELSKKEKGELLNQIERVLEQAKQIQLRLSRLLQGGETDIKYQDGTFWMSQLDEDQGSIDAGAQQLKILREKGPQLVAAIKLYKSLKDLSFHFNVYNNTPSFSAFIGDVAPELELWGDPVFYRLYLLPLAQSRNVETKPPTKEKKQEPKTRKN